MSKRKGANPGALLICMRVSDMPVPGVATAFEEDCSKCGEPVLVSPASYQAAKQGGGPTSFICTRCAAANMVKTGKAPSFEPITPGQLAEMPAHLRPAVAEFARLLAEKRKLH